MAVTRLIDVSWWQGQINWMEVGRTVYRGGICRMTRGGKGVDDTGRHNLRGELDHLPVAGGYGVVGTSEPVEDGARQLLDEIAAVTDPKGVLVMLDAERFADGTGPSRDQINRYATQIHAELGRWPIAYVPDWYLDGLHFKGDGDGTVRGLALANCPWAPSEYFSAPWTDERLLAHKPKGLLGFATLSHLQYTSSATVAGIAGRVDANCYYGTTDQLRAQLLGTPGQEDLSIVDDATKQYLDKRFDELEARIGPIVAVARPDGSVEEVPQVVLGYRRLNDGTDQRPTTRYSLKNLADRLGTLEGQVATPTVDHELLASLLAGKLVIAGVRAEGDRLVITFAPSTP